MLRVLYLAGLTFIGLACRPKDVPLPDDPQPLPALARPTLDGSQLDVNRYQGRVVAVNFWSPG